MRPKKMTKAERRVAIAKDVIAQLKTKRFKATRGTVLGGISDKIIEGDYLTAQLCDVLPKFKKCHVCARGAIFISAVERFNNYTGEDFDADWVDGASLRYFTKSQLDMIECAFEGWGQFFGDAKIRGGAEDRMCSIMKNIIANEGTFRPETAAK